MIGKFGIHLSVLCLALQVGEVGAQQFSAAVSASQASGVTPGGASPRDLARPLYSCPAEVLGEVASKYGIFVGELQIDRSDTVLEDRAVNCQSTLLTVEVDVTTYACQVAQKYPYDPSGLGLEFNINPLPFSEDAYRVEGQLVLDAAELPRVIQEAAERQCESIINGERDRLPDDGCRDYEIKESSGGFGVFRKSDGDLVNLYSSYDDAIAYVEAKQAGCRSSDPARPREPYNQPGSVRPSAGPAPRGTQPQQNPNGTTQNPNGNTPSSTATNNSCTARVNAATQRNATLNATMTSLAQMTTDASARLRRENQELARKRSQADTAARRAKQFPNVANRNAAQAAQRAATQSYAQAQRHYQRAHSLYQQYLAAKRLADSAAEELRAVASRC